MTQNFQFLSVIAVQLLCLTSRSFDFIFEIKIEFITKYYIY